MANNQKFLIIDGHNLLFASYFGMPRPIISSNNTDIRGVIAFLGSIRKQIKLVNPSHILVVFDSERENERLKINPLYKANRKDYSSNLGIDNPFSQYNYILQALDYLKITHFEAKNSEADDVIASYASAYSQDSLIIISSTDKDFYQLIADNVVILLAKSAQYITKEIVINKYGITPKQFRDYKALIGDYSDNIKGIYGIGPKRAKMILNKYQSLSNLLANVSCLDKLANLVISNQQLVLANIAIMTPKMDLKELIELDKLTIYNKDFKVFDVLKALLIW